MKLVAKEDQTDHKPYIALLSIFDANLYLRLYNGDNTSFETLKEVDYQGYAPQIIPRTYKYWKMSVTPEGANVYNKAQINFPTIEKINGIFKTKIKVTALALTDRNGYLIRDYLVRYNPPLVVKVKRHFCLEAGEFNITENV